MMRWHPDGPCAIKREDGAFRIYRAPQDGHVEPDGTVTLVLVGGGKVRGGKRNVADNARALNAAYSELQEKADA